MLEYFKNKKVNDIINNTKSDNFQTELSHVRNKIKANTELEKVEDKDIILLYLLNYCANEIIDAQIYHNFVKVSEFTLETLNSNEWDKFEFYWEKFKKMCEEYFLRQKHLTIMSDIFKSYVTCKKLELELNSEEMIYLMITDIEVMKDLRNSVLKQADKEQIWDIVCMMYNFSIENLDNLKQTADKIVQIIDDKIMTTYYNMICDTYYDNSCCSDNVFCDIIILMFLYLLPDVKIKFEASNLRNIYDANKKIDEIMSSS